MCCKHRRAFSFETTTSESKTTCSRPKSNAYVLHFCFCSVVRHQKICTKLCSNPRYLSSFCSSCYRSSLFLCDVVICLLLVCTFSSCASCVLFCDSVCHPIPSSFFVICVLFFLHLPLRFFFFVLCPSCCLSFFFALLFLLCLFFSRAFSDFLVPFFSDVSCYASVFVLSASHTGFLQLRSAAAAPMLTPLPEKIFAVAGRRPATRLCFSLSRSG